MSVLGSRISLVKRRKNVDSEDGESTSNKSSGSDERRLYSERRRWEVLLQLLITLFPGHPHFLHLHILPAILPGWNWWRPKCWLEITQSSQPRSWAVHLCIKLGLTSPFSPAASHQKLTFLRDTLKKKKEKTTGAEANVQHREERYQP